MHRRAFLGSLVASCVTLSFSCVSDANARGGARGTPHSCSAKLQKMLSGGCSKGDKSQSECIEKSQKKYKQCLKTGTWKTGKGTLTLAKE